MLKIYIYININYEKNQMILLLILAILPLTSTKKVSKFKFSQFENLYFFLSKLFRFDVFGVEYNEINL